MKPRRVSGLRNANSGFRNANSEDRDANVGFPNANSELRAGATELRAGAGEFSRSTVESTSGIGENDRGTGESASSVREDSNSAIKRNRNTVESVRDAGEVSPSPNLPASPSIPLLALFIGGLAIGCGPIFVRLSETAPVATAFWRLFLAQPFLWALWARENSKTGQNSLSRRDLGRMALVGFFFAGDLAVWHWSIKLTSVANATLLGNFAPAFVALFGWFLWREKVPKMMFWGMIVAFGGLVLLMYGRTAPTQSGGAFPALGNALGLLTAAFYAAYMLSAKAVRGQFSSSSLMAYSGAFCSVFLFFCALAMGGKFLPQTMHGWLVLLGLTLITHVLGQSLITYAIAHLSATFSSIGLLIQPVVAAFFAWLLLGEAIGGVQIAGGVLVLSGIVLARRESA